MVALIWSLVLLSSSAALKDNNRPNILFIFTDDQNLHMNSLDYMPMLQKHWPERDFVKAPLLHDLTMLPIARKPLDGPLLAQHQQHRHRPSVW